MTPIERFTLFFLVGLVVGLLVVIVVRADTPDHFTVEAPPTGIAADVQRAAPPYRK